MNDVKILKIVLVTVFVVSAVFTGFNAYRYNQLNQQVQSFNTTIDSAKTEAEARTAVQDLVSATKLSTGASSASAKKDEKPKKNGDCSFSFFGICFSHYDNQPENGSGSGGSGVDPCSVGMQGFGCAPTSGNYNPCFGDYSFGCNGGNPDAWMYQPNTTTPAGTGTGSSGTGAGTDRDPREFCTPSTSDGC